MTGNEVKEGRSASSAKKPDRSSDHSPSRRRFSPFWIAASVGFAALLAFGFYGLLLQLDETPPGFVSAEGQSIFPALGRNAEKVTVIEVERGEDRLTLKRIDGRWGLLERGGYPVREAAVSGLIRTVADLKAIFVSEDGKPLYAKLQIVDPYGPDGSAVRVTFSEGDGSIVAQAHIGGMMTLPGGPELAKVFVRRDDDRRVWMAGGELEVDLSPLSWVEKEIMSLPREEVAEIAVDAPDGETLVVRQPSEGEFRLAENVRLDGRQLYAPRTELMFSAFETLEFEDFRSRDETDVDEEVGWLVAVKTRDDLVYRIRFIPDEGKGWVTFRGWTLFSAEVLKDREADRRTEEGAGATTTSESVDAMAELFNRRHAGWAYRLTPHADPAGRLMVRLEDIVR
jgi:hypothetical protein